MTEPRKLWGGRFTRPTDRLVERFTASIGYDRRLYREDIAGSIAHARMLGHQGIIPPEDADRIVAGLEAIREEIEQGTFPFREELEDIHLNVEARLRERIGEVAGRLHTARSRNDQVALDLRLYVKEAIAGTVERLIALQRSLIGLARRHQTVVLPGYTHLQRAQPVLLAHHLLAYFEMLERDRARFQDALRRTDVMPLGSGALAGVPYPIDRQAVALDLGFGALSRNSLDAVSDRDFVVEYCAAASLAMVHLSRLAEEIVLWSTPEFGFVELDDAYATGSSIMPQKKNPDVAELTRGKTGRVFGHLLGLLTTLKALPLSYNRDLQEDKEALFDVVDTLLACLEVFAGLLDSLRVRADRMAQAAMGDGTILATDLADYLVRKGLPFRSAHEVVGRLVRHVLDRGVSLGALSLEELRQFSPLFEADAVGLSVADALCARNVPGGTGPDRVAAALDEAERLLGDE